MYICTYILAYHDIKSTIFDVVIFDKPSFSVIILTLLSLTGHPLVSLFLMYRKVASSNASRFVTRLVYNHTQKPDLLIRSSSRL